MVPRNSSMTTSWQDAYQLQIMDMVDSSNEEAKRLALAGSPDGMVVWTKSQLEGRGRYEREWVSPEGNLYLSILLRPDYDILVGSQLSFIMALAVGDAISCFLAPEKSVQYKWPNDVLIDGKKVAGILLESASKANNQKIDWMIAGIGINVLVSPTKLDQPVTSIAQESSGDTVSVEKVLDRFMHNVALWRTAWEQRGFSNIRKEWLSKAYGLGKEISVMFRGEKIHGIFKDMDEEGLLVLELPNGEEQRISSGEVFFKMFLG